MFRKIMVANRGEVSARVLKTCQEREITCVAIATDADKSLQFLEEFDAVLPLGDRRGYLHMEKIIRLAKENQISAIHPGWGFLSENPTFASMCEAVGLQFIGPSANAMRQMADKARARETMARLGLKPIPGVDGVLNGVEHALECAEAIGYPVLLKAVAGGGGRGMRKVYSATELPEALNAASAEAASAFGNGAMYMEKLIVGGRHIEFQVICDKNKAYVLGERECSIQRRHQKLLEETPSVAVPEEQREHLRQIIATVCEQLGYRGAGTVEMLGDQDGNIYFMEMNTRLQVEHTITEEVTGIDLVAEQLNVAANRSLDISFRPEGHSIQCRINAENVKEGFRPQPGQITKLRWPTMDGVRIDTHLREGDSVSPHYDSMIAKVIVHASSRPEAIAKMLSVLEKTVIEGVPTTIELHKSILRHERFASGQYDTKFVEDHLEELLR